MVWACIFKSSFHFLPIEIWVAKLTTFGEDGFDMAGLYKIGGRKSRIADHLPTPSFYSYLCFGPTRKGVTEISIGRDKAFSRSPRLVSANEGEARASF
jgi:hypothetical protein